MYGLVLEGGGAKGAYHIGAIRALLENGYDFKGVVGTSIGAINGAIVAQGDFKKAEQLWKEVTYSTIIDVDDQKFAKLMKKELDINILRYFSETLRGTLKTGGFDRTKTREFFEKYINEEKLRKSGNDFGLVTYSLTDRKPIELYIEDIPENMLIDYLLASSQLPIFKSEPIANKYFLDGAIANNCPVNMLADKGYKDLVVIKTYKEKNMPWKKKYEKKGVNFTVIMPVDNLMPVLGFDNELVNHTIKLGYLDTIKQINGLDGYRSYINPVDEDNIFDSVIKYDNDAILEMANMIGIKEEMHPRKMLLERIIPIFMNKMGYRNVGSYKEALYLILEYIAKNEGVDLLKIYEIEDLLKEVKSKINIINKRSIEKAMYFYIMHFKIV